MNVEKLWQHLNSLKVVVLLTTPRGGSDFFQTLIDGHSQVLMMPGQFQFFDFWNEARCKDEVEAVSQQFSWHHKYISRFKSYCEKFERWDNLGPDRKGSFVVDQEAFHNHFCAILKDKELSTQNVFLATHAAYALATNKDPLNTKILFWHVHEHYWLPQVREHFSGFDIIYCTRDPRNTLVSLYNNLILKYHKDSITALSFWMSWVVDDYRQLYQAGRTEQISLMPLELLHLKRRQVLDEFNRQYGLNYEETYEKSTIAGLEWWGDAASGKDLPVINPRIAEHKWHGELWSYDVLWVERLMRWHFSHLPYHRDTKLEGGLQTVLTLALSWLPLHYEVLTMKRLWSLRKETSALAPFNFFLRGYLKRVVYTWKRALKGWPSVEIRNVYGSL